MNIPAPAYERVLSAYEKLWNTIIDIRKLTSKYFFVYSILTPEEYVKVPLQDLGLIGRSLPRLSETEFIAAMQETGLDDIEQHRLFIGEKIWLIFQMHQSFCGRMMLKIIKWQEKGSLERWDSDFSGDKEDKALYQILHIIFTKEELESIVTPLPVAIPQRIQNALEDKIINEMNQMIFGEALLDFNKQVQAQVYVEQLHGELDMSDKVEIRLAKKASFQGNLNAASNIKNSYNQINSSELSTPLKETLTNLIEAVQTMRKELSPEESQTVEKDLEKLIDEATSPQPERRWWSVSAEGLKKAAEKVGEIGKPVLNLVAQMLPLLEAISK